MPAVLLPLVPTTQVQVTRNPKYDISIPTRSIQERTALKIALWFAPELNDLYRRQHP